MAEEFSAICMELKVTSRQTSGLCNPGHRISGRAGCRILQVCDRRPCQALCKVLLFDYGGRNTSAKTTPTLRTSSTSKYQYKRNRRRTSRLHSTRSCSGAAGSIMFLCYKQSLFGTESL